MSGDMILLSHALELTWQMAVVSFPQEIFYELNNFVFFLTGPSQWGDLAGSELCAASLSGHQSPIDIHETKNYEHLEVPNFMTSNGGCSAWSQYSTNNAYEVSFNVS